jgi:superoxide dismutase
MKKTVITIFAFLLGLNIVSSQDQKETKGKVEFPPLPYAFDALEPYIDQKTMEIHYDRHHRAYYNNFIKGIQATEMEGMSMEKIFANMSKYPKVYATMPAGITIMCCSGR